MNAAKKPRVSFDRLLKNKGLVFLFFLVLGILSQAAVLFSPDAVLLNWFSSDDAFYYFKTAQNIAEGRGITFDGISPTNGFHPLWMIVCVPVFWLARFNLYLPLRVLVFILIVLNAGTGYFIYRLFAPRSPRFAFIPAFFWMFLPSIHAATTRMGLETGLTAFMLAFFVFQNTTINWGAPRKKLCTQLALVGLVGLGLLLSRLDNIFILVTVGVWNAFHGEKFNRPAQIDFLLLLLSAVISFFARMQGIENMFEYVDFLFLLMGLSLVLRPSLLFLFGAYKPVNKKYMAFAVRIIAACAISSAFIFGILWMAKHVFHIIHGLSRAVVLIDAAIASVLLVFHHLFHAKFGLLQSDPNHKDAYCDGFKSWLENALYYFGPIVIGLAIYLVINLSYAGTAMPVSGQIKRWWGTLPNTVYGRPIATLKGVIFGLTSTDIGKGPFWLLTRPFAFVFRWMDSIISSRLVNWAVICLLLAAIVYFLIFRERKAIAKELASLPVLPLFVGAVMHALSYKATGYMHVRSWYWMGELMCILLFFSAVASHWIDKISRSLAFPKLPVVLAGIAFVTLFLPFWLSIMRQYPLEGGVPLQYDIPAEVALFERHTQPGDVVGMTGGGLSAYFFPDRTVVNLDGLINSADYFEYLQEGDISSYLGSVDVKYMYGSERVFLNSDPYRWFFKEKLSLLEEGKYFNFYAYMP